MTNAQKYAEVFGFDPDTSQCPANDCEDCPCVMIASCRVQTWWNSQYKGEKEKS